jgi:hypothetical protein
MRRIGVAVFVGVVCGVVFGGGASSVFALSPWWRLASGSRPALLRSGLARDEVQSLTVSATGGEFVLERRKKEGGASLGSFSVPFNATVGELRTGLEGLYGAGNVEVTGGNPYRIVFVGELADQVVRPIVVNASGLVGSASVDEVVAGRSDGEVVVSADNLGDFEVNGGVVPLVVKDVLPAGLRAVGISGTVPALGFINERQSLSCSLKALACEWGGLLAPLGQLEVRIGVVSQGAVSGEENVVSVSGGGAPEASIGRPIRVGDGPVPFGIEDHELTFEEEGGSPTTQAGAHPFQLTDTLVLNQPDDPAALNERPELGSGSLTKDLSFNWPPGLIGDPQAIQHCTVGQFLTVINADEDACPAQTAVGVAAVTVYEPATFHTLTFTVPLFNIEPAVGEPARFGFYVPLANVPVVVDPSLRTGSDYGITLGVHNISESAVLLSSVVTVWGVPGDPRHDSSRGWGCVYESAGVASSNRSPCVRTEEQHPPPFLSLPTACTGPLLTTVEGDSWTEPLPVYPVLNEYEIDGSEMGLKGLDGCNHLPFNPDIKVSPDGQQASKPSGLTTSVHVPQENILNPVGLANSNIKDISVTLPQGVTINPAVADGLGACSEGQVGYLPGQSDPPSSLRFTAKLPKPLEQGLNFCPDSSKIATVKIKTPLLPNPLEGSVYLAAQEANPFGSLVAMYIVAEDPVSGSLVKLPGMVSLSEGTGQIRAVFENTPQLAFEDAELHFFGGERAPLATPARCGTYTTVATFTPWSGNPPVTSTSTFQVLTGPNNTPCPGVVLPFAPALTGGMINNQAGSFSPFTMTMSREDGNQDLRSIRLHTPPGLSGILSGVKLCGETEANNGTCGQESKIGETTVSVGLGGNPFSVKGGEVFLTGSYHGAPFGLSIVNPAKAGPFDLGKVIVRAEIEVDPHTAALTVTSDTTGPYAIPSMLKGIPLEIKHVNVTITRPGFTFNPTNCAPLAITGTLDGTEGSSTTLSVGFQAANCSTLKFAPKFSVSTSGKTSRAKGASLTARLSYPNAAQGTQTNIARVKVDLPKQLPSRLTTLQKACTNLQFEKNPAACPAASKIGYATVTTPLLPVPLTGPAIFVSHGGEAFPSLTMVLQGYGVTVDLIGTTFISKTGITSTTFKTVPDVPFNTFRLTLPQGKYSALAANGNLCNTKLGMPTAFQAQNGTTIHQTTKISVTNCHKHTQKHKKQTHHKKK